ncbi:MAG TPA: hypothetical protein VMW19_08595 [Myxococcota bacterium]|nr:hypothetical protein [Myxococcota bacterium]
MSLRACASALIAVVLAGALACTMNPLPLSAQAGSTILVPIEFQQATLGFGGTQLADPQRGVLVYSLDSPPGRNVFELQTRFTLLAEHDPRSANARDAVTSGRAPAISVVDIPANAPVGRHSLFVVRRDATGDHPVYDDQNLASLPILSIEILPQTLGSIAGQSSPIDVWDPMAGAFVSKTSKIEELAPQPMLEISFDEGSTGPRHLHAVELLVGYPESVINVTRVLPPDGLRNASLWFRSIAPGVIRVEAAAGDPFDRIRLAFQLDSPGTTLDPNDVVVLISKKGDRNGADLPLLSVAGVRVR